MYLQLGVEEYARFEVFTFIFYFYVTNGYFEALGCMVENYMYCFLRWLKFGSLSYVTTVESFHFCFLYDTIFLSFFLSSSIARSSICLTRSLSFFYLDK